MVSDLRVCPDDGQDTACTIRSMSEAVTTPRVGDLAGLDRPWGPAPAGHEPVPENDHHVRQGGQPANRLRGGPGRVDRAAKVCREHVEAFIEDVLSRCRPATASNRYRYRALARVFASLVEEGEVTESPMART